MLFHLIVTALENCHKISEDLYDIAEVQKARLVDVLFALSASTMNTEIASLLILGFINRIRIINFCF